MLEHGGRSVSSGLDLRGGHTWCGLFATLHHDDDERGEMRWKTCLVVSQLQLHDVCVCFFVTPAEGAGSPYTHEKIVHLSTKDARTSKKKDHISGKGVSTNGKR